MISGCPALFIPWDSRMQEFAAYHALPSVLPSQLREDVHIEDLVERVDLTSHLKRHHETFGRFIRFLDKNHLEHIYKDDINRLEAPLDQKLIKYHHQEVGAILHCTKEEAICRFTAEHTKKEAEIKDLKKLLASQTKKLETQTKQLEAKDKQLDVQGKQLETQKKRCRN